MTYLAVFVYLGFSELVCGKFKSMADILISPDIRTLLLGMEGKVKIMVMVILGILGIEFEIITLAIGHVQQEVIPHKGEGQGDAGIGIKVFLELTVILAKVVKL